jgi:DNA repair protein RadC
MKRIRKVNLVWEEQILIADQDQAVYGETVTCSREIGRLVNILIGYEVSEVFLVFLLNAKNQVIGYHETARGGLSACALKPADVYRSAVASGASVIITAHNHPSGDEKPSTEDVMFTKRLKRAGELLGIQLLDHIIIGDKGKYFSFLDSGLLRDEDAGVVPLASSSASAQ